MVEDKIIKIQNWLKKKLEDTGTEGFVIGLSGGVDSAVVSALCKAVTDNTLVLIMPCHSNLKDEEDAKLVIEKFKLKYEKIDLTETYDVLKKALKDEREFPTRLPLDLANIKPRLRMTTLYYFANRLNYLVVGTDNKSESFLGFFTKHGDGACDILPIANLLKDKVYELAEGLDVPKEIIDKEPSAGLWDGQTDQGELGAGYEIIDRLIRLNEKTRHKRELPEACDLE